MAINQVSKGRARVGKFVGSSYEYALTRSGAGSFQPVAVDLTLDPGVGSADGSDPDYIAPAMFNLLGADMTAGQDANYLGGVIGAYSITGTKRTTYPAGAVLGQITDGVTECDGAFVAYIDGDGSQTNAGAAFKVRHNNSTAGSGFDYGLDLYDAAHDGYNAVSYVTSDIRLSNQQVIKAFTTAITANVTTTSLPAGSLAVTSHATGVGSVFRSDGSKWQFLINS